MPKDSLWLDLWAFFVVWQCTGVEKPTSMNAPETTASKNVYYYLFFVFDIPRRSAGSDSLAEASSFPKPLSAGGFPLQAAAVPSTNRA